MTVLAMADQIARMRERFPHLQPTRHCRWWSTWIGPVRPLHAVHTIRLQYVRRYWLGEMKIINGYIPEVTLIQPELQLEHPETGALVPHVYWRDDDPARSTLCLYDPAASQWSPYDFIADTIVPWACEWLACYEGWLATGEWAGGGRHPRRRQENVCRVTSAANRAPPDHGPRAAFHWLGMKTGTFGSFPLMAAASAGSTPPLSWRDWRNATSEADQLRDILISLPVLHRRDHCPRPRSRSHSCRSSAALYRTWR
jgi:hypothetical protein